MNHLLLRIFCLIFVIYQCLNADSINDNAVSLEDCLKLARENYPLYKNSGILDEMLELNLDVLNFGWIPRIKFSGRASYQSDVTALPFTASMLSSAFGTDIDYKPLNKDQYQLNLEISQPLFDSGNTMAQKKVTRTQSALSKAELENDLYKVQQSVIDTYFSLLLLDLQIKQNEVHIQELTKNYNNIKNRIEFGVGLQDDLDKLDIEILSAERTTLDLNAQKETSMNILLRLTMLDNISPEIPNIDDAKAYLAEIRTSLNGSFRLDNRPEWKYFSLKDDEAQVQEEVELSKSLPYIDVFFQGGYGNPGLNTLKSGFQLYYVAGLRVNWDFSNLYHKGKNDELIMKQKLQINSMRDEFALQSNLTIVGYINTAQGILDQLDKYESSIDLSKKILSSSESKLLNGVISINDLISDINNLNLVTLERNYQQIRFLSQIYNIKQALNVWDLQK